MRDIKFRAWDKTNNVWVTQHHHAKYITSDDSRVIYELQTNGSQFEYMQYTGLKDKNGVEIYEGDLIKCKDFPMVQEVMFLNGEFTARSIPADDDWTTLKTIVLGGALPYDDEGLEGGCKVIGNIYETPALLK